MRHRKSFNHLSRKKGHRKAMLANMASSLIIHKRIKTTTAKAKALRMFVEPLITKSKNDSTHTRRVVFSHLQNKEAVSELFREVSPKIIDRPGGYTRILKTGFRLGDNADMCIIELVDYNENLLAAKTEAAAKISRRRRRGPKKKAIEDAQVEEMAEAKVEPGKEEEPQEIKTASDEKPEDKEKPSLEEKAEATVEDVKKETVEETGDEAEVKEEKKKMEEVKDEAQEVKDEVEEVKDEKQEEKEETQEVKEEAEEQKTEAKEVKEEAREEKDEVEEAKDEKQEEKDKEQGEKKE